MTSRLHPINNDKTIQLNFSGTALGFDFGLKRIGVASGEHLLGIAHPLTTLNVESNEDRFNQIAKIIDEWNPSTLVVGLPLTLDGEEHEVTLLCKKFARRLDGRFGLPVVMVDERLSSAEASQSLKEMGIGGRKQKPMLDQIAAQVILQSYFDTISHEMSTK
jgi:putative Holliday junction resolvase